MGELVGSLKEVFAAVMGHAALYGDAASQSLQELKVHWWRRVLWLAAGLLLLHAALLAAISLAALAAYHGAWPSPWAWLLCLVPAALGVAAAFHAVRQQAPRTLLAEVAQDDVQWLRALVEPPPPEEDLNAPEAAQPPGAAPPRPAHEAAEQEAVHEQQRH